MMASGRDPNERAWRDIQSQFQAVKKGLERHDKQISDLGNYAQRLSMSNQGSDQWVDDMYERETRYSNTILLLGYGGFFALWSSTNGKLPAWAFGWVGLGMAVSILLFVGWELAKTIVVDKAIRDYRNAQRAGKRVDPRALINERVDSLNRFHLWVFIPSVVTGLASGFWLLGFFIWYLATH